MQCPKCGSSKTRKRGFEITTKGRKQRHQCKDCGKTFYPSSPIKEDNE